MDRQKTITSSLAAALVATLGLFVFAAFGEHSSAYIKSAAHVALFLGVSIAAHFLYHVLQQDNQFKAIAKAINATERKIVAITESKATILTGVVEASERLGLAGMKEKLDYRELLDSLRAGDELLWLDTFAQSYLSFMGQLRPALEKGATIRMLVIDPDSENTRHRSAEIGDNMFDDPQAFSILVSGFIDTVKRVACQAKNTKGSIEVRTYRDLPCIPFYIVRREGISLRGYSSFFFHRPTDSYFHLRWRYAEGGFLSEASDYFERKWQANEGNLAFHCSAEGLRGRQIPSDQASGPAAVPLMANGIQPQNNRLQRAADVAR